MYTYTYMCMQYVLHSYSHTHICTQNVLCSYVYTHEFKQVYKMAFRGSFVYDAILTIICMRMQIKTCQYMNGMYANVCESVVYECE